MTATEANEIRPSDPELIGSISAWLVTEWMHGANWVSDETIVAEFSGGQVSDQDVRFALTDLRLAARTVMVA